MLLGFPPHAIYHRDVPKGKYHSEVLDGKIVDGSIQGKCPREILEVKVPSTPSTVNKWYSTLFDTCPLSPYDNVTSIE